MCMAPGSMESVTRVDDLLDRLHVVALPMRVRFRGITIREVALIDGPAGWGEFGAFLEYEPPEAAHWLAAGIEAAYEPPPNAKRDRIPINATVPAVAADQVPEVLTRFPGARTARGKDAEPGQTRTVAGASTRPSQPPRRLRPTARSSTWSNRARRCPSSRNCGAASTCRSPPTRASARLTTRCTSFGRARLTSRC